MHIVLKGPTIHSNFERHWPKCDAGSRREKIRYLLRNAQRVSSGIDSVCIPTIYDIIGSTTPKRYHWYIKNKVNVWIITYMKCNNHFRTISTRGSAFQIHIESYAHFSPCNWTNRVISPVSLPSPSISTTSYFEIQRWTYKGNKYPDSGNKRVPSYVLPWVTKLRIPSKHVDAY